MNGASPTPQDDTQHARVRVGATLRMRVPVPVLVPYRTAAGHHGLRIMDRSLNALFVAEINVRFMDRSLNACKTFHNGNQCSIYRTLIHI